jgi:hypothetical protein
MVFRKKKWVRKKNMKSIIFKFFSLILSDSGYLGKNKPSKPSKLAKLAELAKPSKLSKLSKLPKLTKLPKPSKLPKLAKLPKLSMLLIAGTFLGLSVLAPSPAQAYCDCGTISEIVRRAAERIVSGITTPIETTITRAAAYTTQNLHRDLVALREAVLFSRESMVAAIKASDKAQAQREFTRTWDITAQSVTGCGNDQMGAVLLGTEEINQKAGQLVMEKTSQRRLRFSRPVDYLTEAEIFPGSQSIAETLGGYSFGRTYTMSEFSEAQRFLETLSDPMPPSELPMSALSSAAGRIYSVQKKDYQIRQSLYQSVLAKRLTDRAPTAEGLDKWATEKWALMGGEGTPPGLVEGRLSREALFWLLTNLRLSSANWHEQVLPVLPESGLLREIASMMAIELELSRKRNEHLENIALMMALSGLDDLRRSDGEALRVQYRRAIGLESGN